MDFDFTALLRRMGVSRRDLSVVCGLACIVVAVLVLVGVGSYLFTWKQDQSLRDVPEFFSAAGVTVANQGGVFGYSIGKALVSDAFGLGSLLLCASLFILSFRILKSRPLQIARVVIFTLAGMLSLSLLLGMLSNLLVSAGVTGIWEGGLGGGIGTTMVSSLDAAVGPWVTLVLALALMALCIYGAVPDIIPASGKKAVPAPETEAPAAEEPAVVYSVPAQAVEAEDVADEFPVPEVPVVAEPAAAEPAADEPADKAGMMDGLDDLDGLEVTITGPEEELSTDIEEELPKLDIRSDVNRYNFPSLDLLRDYSDKKYETPPDEINHNIEKIRNTLASFRIPIEKISASVGYTVTLYKITLGEGVRVNTVRNLEDDIAIKIGIKNVRVVILADAVGIEVPNAKPSVVPLKAILNSDAFRNCKGELPIAVGYTITTKAKVFDLADAPHLLVAGATKQGKSVGLNTIISSLLFVKHPTELKFVFVDPKMVEFQKYSKLIRHYLALLPPLDDSDEADSAIVKDPKNAESVLRSLCVEMDERYALLAAAGVNKITDYNEKFRNRRLRPDLGHHFMPYLVVVVDEYADLTKSTFGTDKNLSRSIENSINRLAAKGRAAGLHVIIATQRPSVDVITGTIKGNFPTRMAFRTAQRQDSQTILGFPGAERLIGRGDMLFFTGADAERVQCALIDSDEIDDLTNFVASQTGYRQCCSQPYYLPDPGEPEGGSGSGSGGSGGMIDMKNLDSMFEDAAKLAVMSQSISTSMLQRKMQLGFARAARIMDQLEAAGVVGPQQGSRPREALVSDLASLQGILDAYMRAAGN